MVTEEKPIIFSTEMVRAILDGRKTQTRRPIKTCKQHPNSLCKKAVGVHIGVDLTDNGLFWHPYAGSGKIPLPAEKYNEYCPYTTGTRLWVRETFCYKWDDTKGFLDECWYRATDPNVHHPDSLDKSPWKPSIHMPRWASRITLEVTNVRVERVQDISEEDAREEGVSYMSCPQCGSGKEAPNKRIKIVCPSPGCGLDNLSYCESFSSLWNSINAKRGYGWKENPFVWVIEFKVLEVRS